MTTPQQARNRASARRELRSLRAAAADRRLTTWPHWALVVTSVVTLIVAILSAVVSVTTSRSATDEIRQQEGREKKAALYATYLNAVRSMDAAAAKAADAQSRFSKTVPASLAADPIVGSALRGDLAKYGDVLQTASVEFYKQGDQLFVYGSDPAYEIHLELTRLFQLQIVETNLSRFGPALGISEALHEKHRRSDAQRSADRNAVNALITKFQRVFCSEVSPIPRSGCK